jgi:hypothetical protein
MGRLFLFREARPRGDVPGDLGVLKGQRIKGQGQIPPSQITANQIVSAKQPIIRYNQRK